MKKIGILILIFSSFSLYSQNTTNNIEFSDRYLQVKWPGFTGPGGIVGDDGWYNRLALYHSHSISFQTATSVSDPTKTRMYIDSLGNVGIGTMNAQDRLSVAGNLFLDGPLLNDELRFESQNGFNRMAFHELRFWDWESGTDILTLNNGLAGLGAVGINNSTPYFPLDVNGIARFGSATTNDVVYIEPKNGFSSIGFNALRFHDIDDANTTMTIDQGKIGINTTGPARTLDVNGDVKIVQGIEALGSVAGDHTYVGWHQDGTYTNWLGTGISVNAVNLIGNHNEHAGFGVTDGPSIHSPIVWMYNSPNNAFRVRTMNFQGDMTTGDDLMIVRQDGNVGIGTTTPMAKLSVNGQIRATEVKVMTDINVPDYVFQKDYKLRSLQEVENYVNENSHLPEIPSAAEIGEDGLNLAEMNLLLLKKVEELTLYVIELNKELEEVKKK